MEISPVDAEPLGIEEGDLVRVESPRGQLRGCAPASAGSAQGVVFAPFHYGYWDERTDAQPNGHSHGRPTS